MKAKSYRTHVNYFCNDCDEAFQDLQKGRQQAYNHAKSKKHFVTGEIGTGYHYNGRTNPQH